MKSSTTPDFWTTYAALPPRIKSRARQVYQLWKRNPRHPSLLFKKTGNVWSVRIGSGYRAIALLQDDVLYWFWIGTHDEYTPTLCELSSCCILAPGPSPIPADGRSVLSRLLCTIVTLGVRIKRQESPG